MDFESIVHRKHQPPYKPEPLKYNFDEEEFNKGDAEFRKQYQANMAKEFQNPDSNQNLALKNFYFSRENSSSKSIRTNQVNMATVNLLVLQKESQSPPQKSRVTV